MVRCGKPRCACGKDPSKRHGPYCEWTYKARGKTVTVRLAPEAAPFFRAAARQYRKLKTILNRMENALPSSSWDARQGPLKPLLLSETTGYFHIPVFDLTPK